ncbi:MAG: crotonase/enoyl-CoA hydratase family protein [Woeseiaceae bacterium]
MSDRVTVDIQDHIATVTLNRPEKFNAFDPQMFEAVSATGTELSARPDVRAIVLTGAGGNFSAGLDISSMGSADDATSDFADAAYKMIGDTPANRFQHPAWVWYAAPMPVIAAIDGVCLGAGMQVAAGADFRFAAKDARFSILEVKWGLVPDMGFTAVMRDVMRLDHLKQLAYTGRIVSADEALAYGLVSELHDDPVAAAMRVAEEIAGRSPDAVRATKHLVNESWRESQAAGLVREARLQDAVMNEPNQIESVMANVQKRAPNFIDASIDCHKASKGK